MHNLTQNVNIQHSTQLFSPEDLIQQIPSSSIASQTVASARHKIQQIVNLQDERLLVVIGPCSVHDPETALAYAKKLMVLRETYKDHLEIIMRVYLEKPRTTIGWKGLLNDPYLDNSCNLNDGIRIARKLLLDINELGMPIATEFLNLFTPYYIDDLISWAAIGARTVESQPHRELASRMCFPIGFKNSTDGNIVVAVDALETAAATHQFLSINAQGKVSIVTSQSNNDCHIILRGGKETNYSKFHVDNACDILRDRNKIPHVMIDISHSNSRKQFKEQLRICDNLCDQIRSGDHNLFGIMVESNIVEGNQPLIYGEPLNYGQSITDGCIGWADTEMLLANLQSAVMYNHSLKK